MANDEAVEQFSPGFGIALSFLHPTTRPHGNATFPPGVTNDRTRAVADDTPVDWLERAASLVKNKQHLAPMDRCMVVLDVTWETFQGRRLVTEAHCQAVVLEGTSIHDCIGGAVPREAHYLRLDFEPWNLGEHVFPDALPHVHSRVKEAPRFPVSHSPAAPHVDFLELVLRQFFRDEWSDWAERVWIDKFGNRHDSDERLQSLTALHEDGSFEAFRIEPARSDMTAWREAMREQKVRMSPLEPDDTLAALNY